MQTGNKVYTLFNLYMHENVKMYDFYLFSPLGVRWSRVGLNRLII